MTFSAMDFWRLADELSVIDAAILITGNDPSEGFDMRDGHGDLIRDANGAIRRAQKRDYIGFDAAFKALRTAILSDKLKATIGFRARGPILEEDFFYAWGERQHGFVDVGSKAGEVSVEYDTLIRAYGGCRSIFTNRQIPTIQNAETLYILSEPAWGETTIQVDDLKAWLSAKGLTPSFFFPQVKSEGFRDSNHARYSAKLACAVAAWESVKAAKPNLSIKATIEEWTRANAVRFQMVGKDGVPTGKAIAEVATVANWDTGGGAVATYMGVEVESEKSFETIENFNKYGLPDDEPIPF